MNKKLKLWIRRFWTPYLDLAICRKQILWCRDNSDQLWLYLPAPKNFKPDKVLPVPAPTGFKPDKVLPELGLFTKNAFPGAVSARAAGYIQVKILQAVFLLALLVWFFG